MIRPANRLRDLLIVLLVVHLSKGKQVASSESIEIGNFDLKGDGDELMCQLNLLASLQSSADSHGRNESQVMRNGNMEVDLRLGPREELERLVPLVIPIVLAYWMHHRQRPNSNREANRELENLLKLSSFKRFSVSQEEDQLTRILRRLFEHESMGGCVTANHLSALNVYRKLEVEAARKVGAAILRNKETSSYLRKVSPAGSQPVMSLPRAPSTTSPAHSGKSWRRVKPKLQSPAPIGH